MYKIKVHKNGERWVKNKDGELTRDKSEAITFTHSEAIKLIYKKLGEKKNNRCVWEVLHSKD